MAARHLNTVLSPPTSIDDRCRFDRNPAAAHPRPAWLLRRSCGHSARWPLRPAPTSKARQSVSTAWRQSGHRPVLAPGCWLSAVVDYCKAASVGSMGETVTRLPGSTGWSPG
jgi:hypothetical protein